MLKYCSRIKYSCTAQVNMGKAIVTCSCNFSGIVFTFHLCVVNNQILFHVKHAIVTATEKYLNLMS